MKQYLLVLLGLLLLCPVTQFAQSQPNKTSRAFLGIDTDCMSKAKAIKLGFENLFGSYVSQIYKNSAAEKIGIRPFDYIVGINDESVSAAKGLGALLCKYHPDDKVKVHYYRDGELKFKEAILGSSSEAKKPADNEYGNAFLGVSKKQELSDLGGVRIDVVHLSTADRIQMKNDDIIVKINNYPIFNWTDIKVALSQISAGDRVSVTCIRGDRRIICKGFIDSYEQTERRSKADEATQKLLIPQGTDYEQYLENTLSGLTQNQTPVISEAELGPYQIPEVSIEALRKNEYSAALDLSKSNNLEVEKLNLFPHEERGIFELTFLLFEKGDITTKMLNAVGEEVYRFDIQNFEGTFRDQVDLSNTPRGIYFLELSQNGKFLSKKIVLE